MKRTIVATVIMLSSCTAYADYEQTRVCADIGNFVAASRAEMASSGIKASQVEDDIKTGGSGGATMLFLAAFRESGKPVYTTKHDWYMSAAETCLKIIRFARNGFGIDSEQTKDYIINNFY
jgi:hypothetical protein